MRERPSPSVARDGPESAFTLFEIILAVSVLTFTLLSHASLVGTLSQQTRSTRESARAVGAAQACLERIRSHDFATCFAAFDENKSNDPGDAPGPHFDVPGLEASPDDPDGRVGRIILPAGQPAYPAWFEEMIADYESIDFGELQDSADEFIQYCLRLLEENGWDSTPVLREDVPRPGLGTPMDLDGDGDLDAEAKDTTYVRLPVLVEVRWRDGDGERVLRLRTVLTP